MFQYLCSQKTQKANQNLETLLPTIHSTYHDHLKFYCFFSRSPSHRAKIEGQGGQDSGGTVVKAKIGELEEEVMAGNSRRISKELTSVVQCVLGRRSFLVMFQNGCKNNLS